MQVSKEGDWSVSRRSVLVGAAAGALAATSGILAAHASLAHIVPTLPGESSRKPTQVTRGGRAYEVIDVMIGGDAARLFVPHGSAHTVSARDTMAVWFYHAAGDDHAALSGAFRRSAELMVDQGAVCICPDFGGDQWVGSRAITTQDSAAQWMAELFPSSLAFGRGDSSGAALLASAYAAGRVANLGGIYCANGAFDIEDMYNRDENHVGTAYASDLAQMRATSPALLAPSAWQAKRIRLVMSDLDRHCPPAAHGRRLAKTAGRSGASVTVRMHARGHSVPAFVDEDMATTFRRWTAS